MSDLEGYLVPSQLSSTWKSQQTSSLYLGQQLEQTGRENRQVPSAIVSFLQLFQSLGLMVTDKELCVSLWFLEVKVAVNCFFFPEMLAFDGKERYSGETFCCYSKKVKEKNRYE